MASLTQQAIRLSSLKVFDTLKAKDAAWRRCAPHLVRESGGLIHAIHFQGSSFSSSESATFTVNFAVSSRPIYEAWTGRSFPTNPATALFPIQKRIGHLMDGGGDYWWDVTPSTDLDALADTVRDVIAAAENTFFAQYASVDSVLDELRCHESLPGLTKHQAPVVHGIIAALQGAKEEAAVAFRKAITSSPIAAFRSNVVDIAARVGVSV